jgi:hypothetical protein
MLGPRKRTKPAASAGTAGGTVAKPAGMLGDGSAAAPLPPLPAALLLPLPPPLLVLPLTPPMPPRPPRPRLLFQSTYSGESFHTA